MVLHGDGLLWALVQATLVVPSWFRNPINLVIVNIKWSLHRVDRYKILYRTSSGGGMSEAEGGGLEAAVCC